MEIKHKYLSTMNASCAQFLWVAWPFQSFNIKICTCENWTKFSLISLFVLVTKTKTLLLQDQQQQRARTNIRTVLGPHPHLVNPIVSVSFWGAVLGELASLVSTDLRTIYNDVNLFPTNERKTLWMVSCKTHHSHRLSLLPFLGGSSLLVINRSIAVPGQCPGEERGKDG